MGIRYGARGEHVEPQRGDDGTVVGWTGTLTGGDTVRCRVIGIGRDPYVPEVFRELPADRVIHSTQYCSRIAETPTDRPIRAVVGRAQSAAEMFMALHQDLPLSVDHPRSDGGSVLSGGWRDGPIFEAPS